MTDPFTSASPTYIAAQRTNQSKGHGWCFAPELDHLEPWYVRAIEGALSIIAKPYTWFALIVLAGVVSLWWV